MRLLLLYPLATGLFAGLLMAQEDRYYFHRLASGEVVRVEVRPTPKMQSVVVRTAVGSFVAWR